MVGLAALVVTGCNGAKAAAAIDGCVVDLHGRRVSGAEVTLPVAGAGAAGGAAVRTDHHGCFRIAAEPKAQWVRVRHPEYLSRTRAGRPGDPMHFRLTPDDGRIVALHFVGDVMFGRRFYDPNEDGRLDDALVRPDADATAHAALLRHVAPLIEDAHLTTVNLESPLIASPAADPTRPRPATFHQTKEFVFASSPAAAVALREVGVDVVGLGNNHLYDALEPGVASTREALARAGFEPGAVVGAGATPAEAWRPAIRTVRGQRIGFVACTSITGDEHAIDYVAGPMKGGAARCEAEPLAAAVRAARAASDLVVVMIHGGHEYGRDPSAQIQALTAVAREAGGRLVVNHHPHVVGGFDWNGASLVAWTLGNFLFDQTVWPTFESYLLAVHVREGEVVRAYVEPLILAGYVPRGLTGELAEFVARGAAGRAPGPFVVEDEAAELDLAGRARTRDTSIAVPGNRLARLRASWRLRGAAGPAPPCRGRDLLWVGAFESDADTGDDADEAPLWMLGLSARVTAEAARTGRLGLRLERQANNLADVIAAPKHRILVDSGTPLTITGAVRLDSPNPLRGTTAALSLQLSWYADTRDSSFRQDVTPVAVGEGSRWERFRVDATVPPGAVAMLPLFRLAPAARGRVRADIDNVRVIAWAPDSAAPSVLYDLIDIRHATTLHLTQDLLPKPATGDLVSPLDFDP